MLFLRIFLCQMIPRASRMPRQMTASRERNILAAPRLVFLSARLDARPTMRDFAIYGLCHDGGCSARSRRFSHRRLAYFRQWLAF